MKLGAWTSDLYGCIQREFIGLHCVKVSSSDICDKDQEKHDDARSIIRMNTVVLDWFRPSRRVIVIHSVFTILRCEI
jgi:hypothetical protein